MRTDRRTVLAGPAALAAVPLVGAMSSSSEARAKHPSLPVFLANDTAFKEPVEFALEISALTDRSTSISVRHLERPLQAGQTT